MNIFSGFECWRILIVINLNTQTELHKVFSYLDQQLVGKKFLIGDRLTGADFMIGFIVYSLIKSLNIRSKYLNIEQYVKGLENLESWEKACLLNKIFINRSMPKNAVSNFFNIV